MAKAYAFKGIGDYRVGPDAIVSDEDARAAIEAAGRFVDGITERLAAGG